ncbi:MAG: hypothetical protein ACLRZ2_02005 [Veillonella sp.]
MVLVNNKKLRKSSSRSLYFLRGSSSADNFKEKWLAAVSDLNTASQQGLAERFDSTVGANTVLMPFGGKFQKTLPRYGCKLPVLNGETTTASIMTHGFVPELSAGAHTMVLNMQCFICS